MLHEVGRHQAVLEYGSLCNHGTVEAAYSFPDGTVAFVSRAKGRRAVGGPFSAETS